jgi:hypothetical protein
MAMQALKDAQKLDAEADAVEKEILGEGEEVQAVDETVEANDDQDKADNSESLAKSKNKKEKKPKKDFKKKEEGGEKYAVKSGSKTLMYKVKSNNASPAEDTSSPEA